MTKQTFKLLKNSKKDKKIQSLGETNKTKILPLTSDQAAEVARFKNLTSKKAAHQARVQQITKQLQQQDDDNRKAA